MPLPSDSTPRAPDAFAKALAAPESVLLVGGQAVNLWARYYEERTRELAPFVSRDADVLGDRATLELLGRLSQAKPQFFPLKPPSNEVGVVVARDAHGEPLLIEVLRYAKGASNEELSRPAYEFSIGAEEVRVRAPGPIALLKAKVANFAEINQAGRQDGRHVVILARLMPAYLAELRSLTANGGLDERKFIEFLEGLLAVATSRHGRKAWAELHLDPGEFFAELKPDGLAKLKAFLERRVPRLLGTGKADRLVR